MASNIRVTLEIDNKKYLADIRAAENATKSFAGTADKNTTAAAGAFNKLNSSLNGLKGKLDGLKTVLAGIVTVEALRNANEYANAVKDIATTADISIASVIGLGKAFETNGGSAEGARNAILKFGETVGEAIAGSDSAQKALKGVGISLTDIQTKGNEELFKQSVASLGKMENASMRLKAQMDVMGKGAKGVNFPGVNADFGKSTADAARFESAIQAGSDASEQLKKNLGALTQALLNVAEPLNKIVSNITISVSAFESLIKIILAVGASFAVFKYVMPAIQGATNGFYALAAAGSMLLKPFQQLFNHLSRMVGHLGRVVTGAGEAGSRFASLGLAVSQALKFLFRFAGIAGIVYSVVEAVNALSKAFFEFDIIDAVTKKFTALYEAGKKLFNISSVGAGGGRGGNDETLKQQQAQGEASRKAWEAQQKALEEAKLKAAEYAKRVAVMRAEVAKTGDAFKIAGREQQNLIANQIELVGKSEEEVEMANTLEEVYKRIRSTTEGLIDKRKELALSGTEEQKANLGLYDAEIERVGRLGALEIENTRAFMNELQGLRTIEKARLADIENLTRAMEEQAKRADTLAQAQLGIRASMQDIEFTVSQQGKSPFAQQAAQIVEDARKAALEAGRAFAAAFEDTGDGLTPERAKELADGLDAIAKGYKGISDAQLANLEQSRTWSAGWQQAFADYKDSAMNAAEQSRTYFETFTKGMEDVFVNFVRTGKLSFKDLANSLIADFARIQAKKMISGLFSMGSSAGGGGGILAGIGKIFGFANGGNPAIGVPAIVGENGPEMIIPRNATTVVPNGASFGGQPSITQISYNIQATDAQSFKQQLARDPSFVHAVVEQGRRSTPAGARR